jgi:hypothetical protein
VIDITDKDCPKCKWPLHEVWGVGRTADDPLKLKGWYCPHCLYYDAAVGRERQFTTDHKGDSHYRNGG